MEHYSLKQLSLYPLTTQFTLKAINFTNGEIKVFKDTVVYFEYATKYLKYLQHLNTQGFNVFSLPAFALEGGCVDFFLDDISKNGIQILSSDSLKPLYYLETSPLNFQVILRFNTSIPDNAEYLAINRYLVEKYNADPGSIGTKHFFRLAGFTNRKEKHRKNTGYFPFVRLTVGGAVLDKSLLPHVAIAPVALAFEAGRRGGGNCDHYVRVIYLSGGESDMSKLDFKVARVASKKGFTENEIAAAIRRYSPNLQSRKAGHVEDYILRTIRKAALSLNNINI